MGKGIRKFRQVMNPIIECGNTHSLLFTPEGSVYFWGGNLNHNSTTFPTFLSSLPPIIAVSAGNSFSLFIDLDGNSWGLGTFNNGHIFTGRKLEVPTKLLFDKKLKNVHCTFRSGCFFLEENGTVWASVGDNDCGQLGLGDNNPRAFFDKITTLPVLAKRLKKTKSANKH